MKKILVTGGTIFVSKYAAEHYVSRGDKVYVVNRNTHPQPEGVTLIKGDKSQINPGLSSVGFDLVLAVNIYTRQEMKNLLDSLDGNVGRIVFISSSAVYPENTAIPYSAAAPVGANSVWGAYGTNKIEAERELLERYPDAYILRPPYFYGKYQCIYREGFVFDCAAKGMPFYVPGDGSMPLQFYNVSDLCRFMDRLIELCPKKNIFNVGNRDIVDINTYVKLCYQAAGAECRLINVDMSVPQRAYFPFYRYSYSLDVSDQYDIVPGTVPLEEGIREEYLYYIDHQSEVFKRNDYFEYIENNLRVK